MTDFPPPTGLPAQAAPPVKRVNVSAMISFVTSLISVASLFALTGLALAATVAISGVIAIFFGIDGISQARRGARWLGFAIAGVAIPVLPLLFAAFTVFRFAQRIP
ncbi:MAG: hypothetical protein ACOH19_10400 [Rhodoglobus sp.]